MYVAHTCSSMAHFRRDNSSKHLSPRFCTMVSCTRRLKFFSDRSGTFFRVAFGAWSSYAKMNSYDAHPMAMLTSAFAYLGSYYREANPSLQGIFLPPVPFCDADVYQGQNIYSKRNADSFTLMNKQIYRLIGKATTMAAYVQAAS